MKRNDYGYIDESGYKSGDEWMDWLFPICIGAIILFAAVALVMCSFPKSAHAEQAEGIMLKASWYSCASLRAEGTWKHGEQKMANGKRFDENALTCAARLWPLGTVLRVTNVKTGKSVRVVVADRIGKRFAHTRVDLTKAAFARIAGLEQGVVKVRVEVSNGMKKAEKAIAKAEGQS